MPSSGIDAVNRTSFVLSAALRVAARPVGGEFPGPRDRRSYPGGCVPPRGPDVTPPMPKRYGGRCSTVRHGGPDCPGAVGPAEDFDELER